MLPFSLQTFVFIIMVHCYIYKYHIFTMCLILGRRPVYTKCAKWTQKNLIWFDFCYLCDKVQVQINKTRWREIIACHFQCKIPWTLFCNMIGTMTGFCFVFNQKMNVISILDVLSWRRMRPQELRIEQGVHRCRDILVFSVWTIEVVDYAFGGCNTKRV